MIQDLGIGLGVSGSGLRVPSRGAWCGAVRFRV
jgi:hypothetical protein